MCSVVVLFNDLCEQILEVRQFSYRHKTYLAAKNQLGHLLKTFQGRDVSLMNRASWLEHVVRARKENPTRNLNDDKKYFLIVMNLAFSRGLILTPITKLPKPNQENDIGRELSNNEISQLMSVTPDAEMRFLIETAIRLGWRKNEMLRCRWDWFDWVQGTIRLPATHTKTKKPRVIPLPTDLLAAFRERADVRVGPLVFPSPNDSKRPRLLERAWRNIRKRANVFCRWHDLRHTCATRMLRAGTPIPNACRVLGMSPRVLLRIYEHLQVDDLRAAVNSVQIPGK
jgi:integrase